MIERKPDAKQIHQLLRKLAQEDWIRRNERRWWPQFLFHYTDLRNAVSILEDGHLYSRNHVEKKDKLKVSSGSDSVLAGTHPEVKNCVRLYFRPKTPTQFHVEGIRCRRTLSESPFSDAHCPVMVFFLFDAADVLSRASCQFSDGNLGSPSAQLLTTADDLKNLPWKKIYHQGPFDRSRYEESDIIFRRNAEVIVPEKLGLDALKFIYCRSAAEKETLLHLLSPRLKRRYRPKIIATTRNLLFFRHYTFLETVRLSAESAQFQFSPETRSPGPFRFNMELETAGFQTFRQQIDDFNVRTNNSWVVRFRRPINNYSLRLILDGHLAYANHYQDREVPF